MRKLYFYVSFVLVGCSSHISDPRPDYNILNVNQVAHDYLIDTRHYVANYGINEYRIKFKQWSSYEKNQSILVNANGWSQLFIQNSVFSNERNKNQLFELIERTCWALDNTAELSTVSFAYRGIDSNNNITSCIGKRKGPDFPYFVISSVKDLKVGDYLSIITSSDLPNNINYRCKLYREGYNFTDQPLCKVNYDN